MVGGGATREDGWAFGGAVSHSEKIIEDGKNNGYYERVISISNLPWKYFNGSVECVRADSIDIVISQ